MKTRFYQVHTYDPLMEYGYTEKAVYVTEDAALRRIRRLQAWDDPEYPRDYSVHSVVLLGQSKPSPQ